MTKKEELLCLLDQFTGTSGYYKHNIGRFIYTDGVKHLADKAAAYWLLDAIGSYQTGNIRAMPFQVWRLEAKDMKGVLTMVEDSGQPEVVRQEIEYTDFPLEEIELWMIDMTLILPSEY